ncbi:MAG: histidine phosphatase family protein [Clostridia bacterium]|nr:histidine phosphatase family protein [Clostridia bacterium]
MRTVYLLRHSLTAANEAHLYGGSTDLPLTPAGRGIAEALRSTRPLPEAALYVSSGMVRADETLRLLTGREPDLRLKGLREMDFGAFEMRGYTELRNDADYVRWIEDRTGDVPCSGGESNNAFRARVLEAGSALIDRPEATAVAVIHGGPIVFMMQTWFPDESKTFYDWQPGPGRGYIIRISDGVPVEYHMC